MEPHHGVPKAFEDCRRLVVPDHCVVQVRHHQHWLTVNRCDAPIPQREATTLVDDIVGACRVGGYVTLDGGTILGTILVECAPPCPRCADSHQQRCAPSMGLSQAPPSVMTNSRRGGSGRPAVTVAPFSRKVADFHCADDATCAARVVRGREGKTVTTRAISKQCETLAQQACCARSHLRG